MEGILTDTMIAQGVEDGSIRIDPYDPNHLNPASYDLTLGDEVVVYKQWVECFQSSSRPHASYGEEEDGRNFLALDSVLDVKREPEVQKFKIDPERGWVLKPNIGYLMHTKERIWTERYVPVVDGKSSIGRLFLQIHCTAGYGDAGFNGEYTLEVITQHPVRVYPGMRIGQIRFHTMHGDLSKPYDGNYVGDSAKGAVPSRAWKQFKR
jgi:dCTP deaminase